MLEKYTTIKFITKKISVSMIEDFLFFRFVFMWNLILYFRIESIDYAKFLESKACLITYKTLFISTIIELNG